MSVRLANASSGKALATVLAAVADRAAAPAYGVREDGTVVVSTRADVFAKDAVERSYPLGDFVGDPATARDARTQIRAMVCATIRPDTWAARPGDPGGTATVDGDRLRVVQTADVQEWVDALLQRLRDERVGRP